MITIATKECGKAKKHEFRNPYTLSSMLAKLLIDMKTFEKNFNFALKYKLIA